MFEGADRTIKSFLLSITLKDCAAKNPETPFLSHFFSCQRTFHDKLPTYNLGVDKLGLPDEDFASL